MKPVLHTKSGNDDSFLESIVTCIASVDCTEHFAKHLGKPQSEQAPFVRAFQQSLASNLAKTFPEMTWTLEHLPNESRKDAIDIFGKSDDANVVIELDKHRADQIAKKFVSRSAAFPFQKIYYISLCYPGTDRMNVSECVKYFGYCATLSKRMGNVYAGFIIQETSQLMGWSGGDLLPKHNPAAKVE